MITLPKISVTPESDVAGVTAFDKSAPDAGSFLALLSQAMPGLGDGKTLNPDIPGTQKPGLNPADVDGADGSANALLDTLLAGLDAQVNAQPETASELKSVVDKMHTLADDKTLNEQDMAALSALFAMLPHQQTAALNNTQTGNVASDIVSVTGSLTNALTGDVRADLKTDGKTRGDAQSGTAQALPNAAVAPLQPHNAVQAASNTEKLFNDANANSPVTPSAMQPLVSSATATTTPTSGVVTTPHTAVLNAQLGTAEWQHAFSQQVTLFTRNGQQSAELRLNPESLGQVQISLKIDDNLAQMQFVSPHSHVRAALEAALPTLRTQLAESGIELGQSNISSESFAGQQQQQGQSQQSNSRGGSFSFTGQGEETVVAPASLQGIARGDNAVDIFA